LIECENRLRAVFFRAAEKAQAAVNHPLTLEHIRQLRRKLRDPINCAAIVAP